ncbi:MAG TPA: FHA domain-containing protein, partial [Bryobacteraceae bacterium]|nr:FHA domain-containing protein [Bryobacteraceae bacterium]
MAWSNVLEKLGKAVFESPFGANQIANEAPELAEIRLAALEAVKSRSHRVSDAMVFPYDLVKIHLLGVPESEAAVFRSGFLLQYFTEELCKGLKLSNFRFPSDLLVEFQTVPAMPGPGERWISVETEMRPREAAPINGLKHRGVLTVVSGTAAQPEIVIDKERINIGRTADTYHTAGPSRRNDLVFAGADEIDRTVSREHAHILRSADGSEYRLFNDRVYRGDENCGLWIVRDGLGQPVHRSSRGTLLQAGDEIHIGRALVR